MGIYWYMTIAVLLLLSQMFIYHLWAFRNVHYTRQFSTDSCYAGDHLEMVEVIENRKWLPLPWLRLESRMHVHLTFNKDVVDLNVQSGDTMQNHNSFFNLMAYKRIRRTHHV